MAQHSEARSMASDGVGPGGRKYKHLWMVEEARGEASSGDKPKSFWTKIGVAFENRDGSWSLHLAALPMDGRLQMRDPWPKEEDLEPRLGRAA